jgi:hypothetical protein
MEMSLKYCDDCHEPVEQVVMSCPECKCTTFVHGAEIMKRNKKERANRPKTPTLTPTLTPNPESTQRTQKSEKSYSESSTTPTPVSTIVLSKTGKTLDDLIAAQNKTTHAVRAFVRFLFIQLTGLTLAVFLWNLSLAFINSNDCLQSGENCSGNVALQFMAVGVWIATVILSSRAGWDELQKSDIK